MPLIAFFLLLVIPAVEIFVTVQVAQVIGWEWTLLALLAGAVLGVYVMRRAGSSWWRALRAAPTDTGGVRVVGGAPDGAAAARAALLFVAGLLIFLPGFISDVVGLVLLLPPVRSLLQVATAAWFVRRFTAVTGPGGVRLWTRSDRVVRGEVVREDQPPGPARDEGEPPRALPGS
jgi:UPF0716 protein FxsA